MARFTVEIADTVKCWECGADVPLGTHPCPGCREMSASIPFAEFFELLERGEVLHARMGGLVIGREDVEDDIPMFRYMTDGIFKLVGLMQGGEYLMNPYASVLHLQRLTEINAIHGDGTLPHSVTLGAATSVINTNHITPSVILWIQPGQFVVNRHATALHLAELEQLNMDNGHQREDST